MTSLELFRFRTVRSVEHKKSGFGTVTVRTKVQTPLSRAPRQPAINPTTLLGKFSWLQDISDWLASFLDRMSPNEVIARLPANWLTQVSSTDWNDLRQILADTVGALALEAKNASAAPGNYGVPVIDRQLCEEIELISRLILVHEFISSLAREQSLPQTQREILNADDVRLGLSFRNVALPAKYFSRTPPVLARQPGVTDLFVVKDEWNRYVPGELANIVNILPGETLGTTNFHLEETVRAQSTSSERTTSQTTENSQTSTQTLSSTAANEASINIGVQGQVETSGQYGPTNVKTSVGAQVQVSKSTATTTAVTKSMETVARAVKTVSETIVQTQSTRTKIRNSTRERHSLQNSTSTAVIGMYRWLSEIHRVQVVNYPNRFVLEFEIPEPGAWLRYALINQPEAPWDNPDPGAFSLNNIDPRLDPLDPANPDLAATPLQPSDLSPAIVAGLAARWRVQGITSPPPPTLTLASAYSIVPQTGSPIVLSDNSLLVPDGYVAQNWFLDVTSAGGDDADHATNLRVSVGGYGAVFSVQGQDTYLLFWGNQSGVGVVQKNISNQTDVVTPSSIMTTFPVGDINTGTVPISAQADFLGNGAGLTLNVGIQCAQIPAVAAAPGMGQPYVTWQINTFNTIAAAYQNLLDAHNQERAIRRQSQNGPLVVGPPDLDRARAAAELKRLAIQNLLGQPFMGYDLLAVGPTTSGDPIPNLARNEPGIDPAATKASSPVIQFFEQVFEWENIVYICYPYFWGARSRWVVNATTASADPVFDRFLNAGSARLVVPARPGFEHMVNFFLYTSCIWSGQNPPAPNESGYLSIADEIRAVQVGATDGTPIYPPWEVSLPTTLLWAGTDPTTLPSNTNPTIGAPPQPTKSAAMTIASSVSPSVFGQPVIFSVAITPGTGSGGPTPTGQVEFKVDGATTPDSPIAVDSLGHASCSPLSGLTIGSHAVSARYLGDSRYSGSIVNLPTQTVQPGASQVAVTGNPNPVRHRRPVAFTATVTAVPPAAGIPTGQVRFLVDGTQTPDSPVTLDGTGVAKSAPIATLTRGTRNVSAEYLGDLNFAAGNGTLTETVT